MNSLQDDVTRGVKPALLAVLGAVMLVLADRMRERDQSAAGARRTAARRVRHARRAGRGAWRLVRQLLTESLLLAISAALSGWWWRKSACGRWWRSVRRSLPRIDAIRVDGDGIRFSHSASPR